MRVSKLGHEILSPDDLTTAEPQRNNPEDFRWGQTRTEHLQKIINIETCFP
jgi:hypothetical protein